MSISNEVLLYGSPIIGLFCLTPLYVALYKSKSYKESSLLVALQVLTVHLTSSFWLANFRDYAALALGASAFGTVLEAWLCGFFFYILPSKLSQSRKLQENAGLKSFDPFFRILYFSACWLFYEWIKSVGFLGYPWGTLPAAAYKFHLITQIADITGVWGITFIFAMFSGLVGEIIILLENIQKSQAPEKMVSTIKQCTAFVFTVFGIATLYGIIQYNLPRNIEKQFDTILIQQNIDPWESSDSESIEISSRLTELKVEEMKEQGISTDLIVWSEGVLERTFPNASSYYTRNPKTESLSEFISRMEVPFIIGGTVTANRGKGHYYNSAILYDASGHYSGFYSKIHLVPFAEAIPFINNPIVKSMLKKIMGFSTGLISGNQYVTFQIPLKENKSIPTPLEYRKEAYPVIRLNKNGFSDSKTIDYYSENKDLNPDSYVTFTTPICFEDSFNDVCSKLYNAGSEVFINITNDSWSKSKASEIQHFIESSYRAIEYRTTLVRCANSGYTVVVNPAGKIIADLPLFEEGALGVSIPIYERKHTIYSIYGDWFVRLVLFTLAVYILSVAVRIYWNPNPAFKKRKRIVIRIETISDEDNGEDEKISITENNSESEERIISEAKIIPTITDNNSNKSSTTTKKRTSKKETSTKKAAEKKETTAPKVKKAATASKAKKTVTAEKKSSEITKSSTKKTAAQKKTSVKTKTSEAKKTAKKSSGPRKTK